MKRTRKIVVGLVATLALLTSACGGDSPDDGGDATGVEDESAGEVEETEKADEQEPSEGPDQLSSLSVGYGVATIGTAAAYMTAPLAGGYWEEEGYDVEIVPVDGATTAFQSLAQGQLDYVMGGTAGAYGLVDQGASIISVANVYDTNTYYPVVLEESDIESIADFSGRTVGLQSLAASQGLWLDALLEQEGMTRDDLEAVIAVGDGTAAVQAMQEGEIDIALFYHGAYFQLEEEMGVSFRRFDDVGEFADASFAVSLWTHADTLAARPEEVEAVVRGFAKGIVTISENAEAVIEHHYDMYPQTRPAGNEEDAVAKGARSILNNMEYSIDDALNQEWGYATDKMVDTLTNILVDSGGISEYIEPGSVHSNEVLDEANDYDLEAVLQRAEEL